MYFSSSDNYFKVLNQNDGIKIPSCVNLCKRAACNFSKAVLEGLLLM